MLFRSSFSQRAGSLKFRLGGLWLTAGLFAVTASGCSGCNDSKLTCDQQGNCQICDAYGCSPANPETSGGLGGGGSAGTGTGTGGHAGTGGSGGSAPQACDPSQATCPCGDANGCAAGTQCVGGLCIGACDFSYECGPGKVCDDGACVPGCDATTPCATGYTCDNGACVVDPQNPECSATTPCTGSGEICVGGLCTTSCTASSQCATGEVCNGATGSCIPDPSTHPVCDSSKPCATGQACLGDGFCHYECQTLPQCKLIDNRFVACDGGYCKTQEEINPECTLESPCPAGKSCISNHCE